MDTIFTMGRHTHNKKTRKGCSRNHRLSPFPLGKLSIRDSPVFVKPAPLHIPDLTITHITAEELKGIAV